MLYLKHYLVPNWPAPKNIKSFSTTRLAGHSTPPFASFNIGEYSEDDPQKIIANRLQLHSELQLPNEPTWLHQVHGNTIIDANHTTAERLRADASYSKHPGKVCVVSTADCLPILLCDTEGTCVAAIHAGWKGLVAGVIEATLETMQIPSANIMAWLGPAIGPEIFEVGDEVRQQFLKHDPKAQQAFTKTAKPEKWLADLYHLARQRLNDKGVTKIYGGGFCTYKQSEWFYSYRRDQGKTGRMASLIWF